MKGPWVNASLWGILVAPEKYIQWDMRRDKKKRSPCLGERRQENYNLNTESEKEIRRWICGSGGGRVTALIPSPVFKEHMFKNVWQVQKLDRTVEPINWGPICNDMERKGKLSLELMRMGNKTSIHWVPGIVDLHTSWYPCNNSKYIRFVPINKWGSWGFKRNVYGHVPNKRGSGFKI